MSFFRLVCMLFLLLNCFSHFAQQAYSEKDKKNFTDGAYKGCLDKQNESAFNKSLKDGVVEKLCTCYGKRITDELFSDMNFQIAIARNDSSSLERIVSKMKSPEVALKFFNMCMSDLEKKYGGKQELFSNANMDNILSKAIGLTGEERKSFLLTGIDSCIANTKSVSSIVAKKYCNCSLNLMADNLSASDLHDLMMKADSNNKKLSVLTKNAANKCAYFLVQ